MNPTALDLTTVVAANQWIFGAKPITGNNAFVLQMLISSLSLEFLRRTGTAAQNGSVPTQSPFNEEVTYSETYSGYGTPLIQLRNFPILSVASVVVGTTALPLSAGDNSPGYYIDPSGKFLCVRGAGGNSAYIRGGDGWSGWNLGTANAGSRAGWPRGINNIAVTYSAGFVANSQVGELQTIPTPPPTWAANTGYANGALIYDGVNVQQCTIAQGTAPVANSGGTTPSWNAKLGQATADGPYLVWTNLGAPYTLIVNNAPWLSDDGVAYFSDGTPLTAISNAPVEGEYYLAGNGAYLFAAADAGKQVLMSYTYAGTPLDIQEAMLRWINLIYNRRGWEGIRSLMQKDAGSTVYTSFEIDPSIAKVIEYYKRRA